MRASRTIPCVVSAGERAVFGKNELQPDLEVVPVTTIAAGRSCSDAPLPILVVEILSAASRDRIRDLQLKRHAYLRLDMPEYWIVDRKERCVHLWSRNSDAEQETVETDVLCWQPRTALEPFEITIDQLFPYAV